MSKKIFIIAGESSGDLHGKNLVKEIFIKYPDAIVNAYGGKQMESAGATISRNYEKYAFMGFFEVAKNIRTVLRNIKITQDLILTFNPDILVFIDFPGFNLRVAKALRSKLPKTKFIYYIAPQVWAWKSKRVHEIDKLMDEVLVILPFEQAYFAQYGYTVNYAGHPLLDEIKETQQIAKEKNKIAILPGSRKQEIQKLLPIFSSVADLMPNYNFEISKMDHISRDFYDQYLNLSSHNNIHISGLRTYDLLASAELAIVTSGTATLETALLNTPLICAYKTSPISYWIAKRLVKVKYISLVNLILDKAAIPELIQKEVNVRRLKLEIEKLLDSNRKQETLKDFKKLKMVLGDQSASKSVVNFI
jgi:lipid-A-disaccharide synthase